MRKNQGKSRHFGPILRKKLCLVKGVKLLFSKTACWRDEKSSQKITKIFGECSSKLAKPKSNASKNRMPLVVNIFFNEIKEA